MAQLKAFAGLGQALARLILRDGRTRKEIAEAAGLNASMLSGFLSGRRIPSLEHLDLLLTELGVGVEELTYELREVNYRSGSSTPLVLWPRFFESREGVAAAELLNGLLENLRALLGEQARGGLPPGREARTARAEDDAPPERRQGGRGRRRGGPGD